MKKVISTLVIAALPLAVSAQTISLPILETELTAGDYDASGLAVSSTGVIYAVDTDGDDRLLRITPGTPNTVEVITTVTEVYAAIDAVNGTNAVTGSNIRFVDIADDGDIIIVGFASGATGDYVASVSDTVPGTVSVVYAPVDGDSSVLDGSSALTVIGNTAYVSTDSNNGDSNELWAVDTNSGLIAPTELVSESDLTTATGLPAADVGLNALTNDGTDILATVSATASASDDILRITTAGVISTEVTGANIVAGLNALDNTVTDTGYAAIAYQPSGEIWLTNPFGDGSFDGGFIILSNISGGNATVDGIDAETIDTAIGSTGPFIGNDGIDWDVTNGRLVFSSGDVGSEGIGVVVPAGSNVTDWIQF